MGLGKNVPANGDKLKFVDPSKSVHMLFSGPAIVTEFTNLLRDGHFPPLPNQDKVAARMGEDVAHQALNFLKLFQSDPNADAKVDPFVVAFDEKEDSLPDLDEGFPPLIPVAQSSPKHLTSVEEDEEDEASTIISEGATTVIFNYNEVTPNIEEESLVHSEVESQESSKLAEDTEVSQIPSNPSSFDFRPTSDYMRYQGPYLLKHFPDPADNFNIDSTSTDLVSGIKAGNHALAAKLEQGASEAKRRQENTPVNLSCGSSTRVLDYTIRIVIDQFYKSSDVHMVVLIPPTQLERALREHMLAETAAGRVVTAAKLMELLQAFMEVFLKVKAKARIEQVEESRWRVAKEEEMTMKMLEVPEFVKAYVDVWKQLGPRNPQMG